MWVFGLFVQEFLMALVFSGIIYLIWRITSSNGQKW